MLWRGGDRLIPAVGHAVTVRADASDDDWRRQVSDRPLAACPCLTDGRAALATGFGCHMSTVRAAETTYRRPTPAGAILVGMTAELTLDDLVARLGHSRDWWKREVRRKAHPHLRVGREIRFTEEQYREIRDSYLVLRPTAQRPSGDDPLLTQTSRSRARNRARGTL